MEKKDQLLTVSQAAKELNVSSQYIYQQLKKQGNKFAKYVVMVDNRRFLRKDVVQELKTNATNDNGVASNDVIIKMLQEQLCAKDEQIARQQETIEKLLAMYQSAIASQTIKTLEDKQEEQEPKKRKGLFSWFRKRNK